MFSFVGPCRRISLVIYRMISTTEDTLDITRSLFSLALVCQVITCSFDVYQFEMTINFGVLMSLAICTLSNISFVFKRFEFYFTLLYIFYIEYVIIRGRFQFYKKNMEKGSLVLHCLIFQMFVTMCFSFSITVLISSGLIE
jgi:hypothetical protein